MSSGEQMDDPTPAKPHSDYRTQWRIAVFGGVCVVLGAVLAPAVQITYDYLTREPPPPRAERLLLQNEKLEVFYERSFPDGPLNPVLTYTMTHVGSEKYRIKHIIFTVENVEVINRPGDQPLLDSDIYGDLPDSTIFILQPKPGYAARASMGNSEEPLEFHPSTSFGFRIGTHFDLSDRSHQKGQFLHLTCRIVIVAEEGESDLGTFEIVREITSDVTYE